jgi:hypothetical protein
MRNLIANIWSGERNTRKLKRGDIYGQAQREEADN